MRLPGHEETTPLLGEANGAVVVAVTNNNQDDTTEEEIIEAVQPVHIKTTVSILTVIIVLAMFCNFMSIPAQSVIFEQIICKQYFAAGMKNGTTDRLPLPRPPFDRSPPNLDNPCKAEPVQSELGLILGWKDTFEVLPTLMVSVPYGMLADRWGRRPIMFLALFGTGLAELAARVVCYYPQIFPLRAVWYGNVFNLIGGGGPVASSMIFTVIADITAPDKRADIYVIIFGGLLVAESLGTPLGAALIDATNPWIPYSATPIGILLASLWVFAIPETKPRRLTTLTAENHKRIWNKVELQKWLMSMQPHHWPRQAIHRTSRALRALWHNISLVCLVIVFFTAFMRRQVSSFIVLYASKKFNWPLSRASYLTALRSATNLVLLLLILPAISHWLLRFLSAPRKDLVLLRVQSGLIAFGAALVAIAAHPVPLVAGVLVFGLGAGFDINGRSLATSLVQRTHFATLNGALAFSEALGMMCAGPVLAATWAQGLHWGGVWLGLPFAVAALVFAAALLITTLVRVRDAEEEAEEQERESLIA